MAKKAPRRTAERILDHALDLFNRFGEPNVSTTLIASGLGISTGNLYYHYPAKDALINRLHEDYARTLADTLQTGEAVENIAGAERFVEALFDLVWRYRFLYRDLNDLLSKNRQLEMRLQQALRSKEDAIRAMLTRLCAAGQLIIDTNDADMLSRNMVVLLTYWPSYEYVGNPREAFEPSHADQTLARGRRHTLHLFAPYCVPRTRGFLPTPGVPQPGEDQALHA